MEPKNPQRVPRFSQVNDPKGSQSAPRHVIGLKGSQAMTKAETTGTYKDANGGQWFFREGAALPEGMTLVEAADRNAGAPEKRDEDADEVVDEVVHEEPVKGPKGKDR